MKRLTVLVAGCLFGYWAAAQLTVTTTFVDETCFMACDGSATAIATGGTPPYTYQWDATANSQTTATATGLCSILFYQVTVTDALSATASSFAISSNPPQQILSGSTSILQCSGFTMCDGSASLNPTGGVTPYTYSWDANTGSQTTATATGLCANDYTVTLTDANGCTIVDSITITCVGTGQQELCFVTLDNTYTDNLVVWEKPVTSSIDSFKIYREGISGYEVIGSQPYASFSTYVDTDPSVDPLITSYRYAITSVDMVGVESSMSAYHETIHLTAATGVGNSIALIWTPYGGFTPSYYRILRDAGSGLQAIDSLPASNTTYNDVNAPPGVIGYVVEAIKPGGCSPSLLPTYTVSRSNIATGTTSVDELPAWDALIDIYPNPTNGSLTLTNTGLISRPIRVTDLTGRTVLTQPVTGQQTALDLYGLTRGVYIVQVETQKGIATRRVVKQ